MKRLNHLLPSHLMSALAPQNSWPGSDSSEISVQLIIQMRSYMDLFTTHFLFYLDQATH